MNALIFKYFNIKDIYYIYYKYFIKCEISNLYSFFNFITTLNIGIIETYFQI